MSPITPLYFQVLVTLSQDHWRLVQSEKILTEENCALRRRANTFDDEALGFREAETELTGRLEQQQAAYQLLEADYAAVKKQLVASQLMNDLLTFQLGAVSHLAQLEEADHVEELAAVFNLANLMEEDHADKLRAKKRETDQLKTQIGAVSHLAQLEEDDHVEELTALIHLAQLEEADHVEELAAVVLLAEAEEDDHVEDLHISNTRSTGLFAQLEAAQATTKMLEHDLSEANIIKKTLQRQEMVRKDRQRLTVSYAEAARCKRQRDWEGEAAGRPARRPRVHEEEDVGLALRRDRVHQDRRDFQANDYYM